VSDAKQSPGHTSEVSLPSELEILLRPKEVEPRHWRAAVQNFAGWCRRLLACSVSQRAWPTTYRCHAILKIQ